MKTLQEMFNEIEGSEILKNELKEIRDQKEFLEFLKKQDCETTSEEIAEFFRKQSEGEVEDDVAEAAAGGYKPPDWKRFLP